MRYYEIVNKKQYQEYCNRHLEIGKQLGSGKKNKELESEYYILDLVMKDYLDKQINPFDHLTPVDLLEALMDECKISGYKLAKELKIQQSVISEILHYKREFSKSLIRKLSEKFNIGQESFMKEYELTGNMETV